MDKLKNNNLEKLIKKYITKNNYGKYTNLIREIISRRYLVYDYLIDENRVIEELQAFTQIVKTIRAATPEELNNEENNVLGYLSPERKEIVYYKERCKSVENLYKIMTHEIYHALSIDAGDLKSTGLLYYRRGENEAIGRALNESFNEYGAYLAYSVNRKNNNTKDGIHTLGYTDITFAPQLLAAVFGLPERTIVGQGLKNRGNLFESLCATITEKGDTKKNEQILNEFNSFEANLNILFNLSYDKNSYQNIDDEQKDRIKKSAIEGIIDYGYSQLRETTISQLRKYDYIDEESINKYAYCYYKLEEICYGLTGSINNREDIYSITKKIMNNRQSYGVIITDLNKITRISEKITNKEDRKKYIKMVCNGDIDNAIKEIKDKYGISVPTRKEEIGDAIPKEDAYTSDYAKFIDETDYEEIDRISNKVGLEETNKIIGNRNTLFQKIKNSFNRVFNRQKAFPVRQEEVTVKTINKKESIGFAEKLHEEYLNNEGQMKKRDIVDSKNKDKVRKDEEDKEL